VKKGGFDQIAKHKVPDEWRVLEHEEFVMKYPGTCPPNHFPEHPDEPGITVETDKERAWRLLGLVKMFAPVAEVLERLTPEERSAIEDSLKVETCEPEDLLSAGITREQILEHLRKLRDQVPIRREQPKSLSVGNRLFPTDAKTKSLSVRNPIPYGCDNQVPTDRETFSNTFSNTPPTTPTTSPAKVVDGEVERRSEKSKPQSISSESSAIDATSFRALCRRMEDRFAKFGNGEWNVRKGVGKKDGVYHDDWKDLEQHVVDYGGFLVEVAWIAFVKADDLPNGWKYPLMKFNSDFSTYLRKAENGDLFTEVVKVRQEIEFWGLGEEAWAFQEFLDTLTPEEKRLNEGHRDWLKRNKHDDRRAMKFDLGQAGPLMRLKRRAKDWDAANKDLIERRYQEQREWEEREIAENPHPDFEEDFAEYESKKNKS
jgi:hypothetical protein